MMSMSLGCSGVHEKFATGGLAVDSTSKLLFSTNAVTREHEALLMVTSDMLRNAIPSPLGMNVMFAMQPSLLVEVPDSSPAILMLPSIALYDTFTLLSPI